MYSYLNDYNTLAHPKILERMQQFNFDETSGYYADKHSDHARQLIQAACQAPEAQIFFAQGGTLANLTLISASLRSYESIVAAETAHINQAEAGAIEATGHKILTVPSPDGKLSIQAIEIILQESKHFNKTVPGAVLITNTTELGAVYNVHEIKALYEFCQAHDLLLLADGARLGSALAIEDAALTLSDMARYTDAFVLGGTKNGALLGEAIVITNGDLARHFDHALRQHGGMMAKGKVIGIQFETLFTDTLYIELAKHANLMAGKLAEGFRQKGYDFYVEPVSNQLFITVSSGQMNRLAEQIEFTHWEKLDDDQHVLRFVTSWSTRLEKVEKTIDLL